MAGRHPLLSLAYKASVVWLLILALAVVNGAFRESFLVPRLGAAQALITSGLLLSFCIVVVSVALVPWFGELSISGYLRIGALWLGLTVAFEFGFGRLVQHQTWSRLLDAYTLRGGNLWPLVLLVTALAPWFAAYLRGCLRRARGSR